jgi:hypothetical protein
MRGRRVWLLLLVLLPALVGRPADVAPGPWRALGAIQPRLSPDGASIAVSYQGSIWRLPREGGPLRRLTAAAGFDSEPAWSPDGRRIAFIRETELKLIDAETGAELPLPAGLAAPSKLFFHPDGTRLLANAGRPAVLSWVDLTTGAVRPATDPPRRLPVFALSPDGTQIAYALQRDVEGEQTGHNGPQADLWIAPVAGGAPRALAEWPSRVFDLWWGGRELYLVTDAGGAHNDLWTLSPADPRHSHKVSFGQADEDAPSTSADGRRLAFADNRRGATAVVVRDLATDDERTVEVAALEFGVPVGTLRIDVVEKGAAAPLTARLSLRHEGGRFHAPPGALYRISGGLEHFYAENAAELVVPAGRYVLRGFRGTEYRPAGLELEVPAGGRAVARLELERWCDPTRRGWYSGESHIHANYGYGAWYNTPESMRLQIAGEGLNAANFVVANSDTDGIFDREFFRGAPDPLSTPAHVLYWNQEFRATLWGHMTLYNLRHLVEPIMTGFKDTTNPWDAPTNADVADHARLQGGHVNYTHPAGNARDPYASAYSAKAMPVDVALGKIDSIDINWSYEPTLSLWYRLLNCGFRLPASAGTDCFLNRIRSRLPGADRAYVRLDGPFSYAAWVAGLKAGRSFVTNGPILELSAAGKGLGDTIVLAAPGPVEVRGRAEAAGPIDRLELVVNGAVAATGDAARGLLDQPVRIDKSGWMSLRVFAGAAQAHTSPIYVEVAGRPAASREDAEYYLAWIDRLERQLAARDRLPSPAVKAHVARQLEAAREVYREVIKRAGS